MRQLCKIRWATQRTEVLKCFRWLDTLHPRSQTSFAHSIYWRISNRKLLSAYQSTYFITCGYRTLKCKYWWGATFSDLAMKYSEWNLAYCHRPRREWNFRRYSSRLLSMLSSFCYFTFLLQREEWATEIWFFTLMFSYI